VTILTTFTEGSKWLSSSNTDFNYPLAKLATTSQTPREGYSSPEEPVNGRNFRQLVPEASEESRDGRLTA